MYKQEKERIMRIFFVCIFALLYSINTNAQRPFVSIEIYLYKGSHDSTKVYTLKGNDILFVNYDFTEVLVDEKVCRHIDSIFWMNSINKAFLKVIIGKQLTKTVAVIGKSQSSSNRNICPFVYYDTYIAERDNEQGASIFDGNKLIFNYSKCK